MKKALALLLALAPSTAGAQAVKSVPQVQTQINSTITTNNAGAITGAILNSALNTLYLSAASRLTNQQLGTSYNIDQGDRHKLILFNNALPVNVTLGQAGANGIFENGWQAILANNGTANVTVTPTISNINGVNSLTLTPFQSVQLVSDGTNYFAVGNLLFPNSIGPSLLRQSIAKSVMGNGTNATANVADLTGTADQVLRQNSAGTALAFGQVNLAAPAAVTGILAVVNGGTGGLLPVANGGTNAATAPAARASLNVEAITPHGDSDYTILSTDRTVTTSASLTAIRTWTLPAASSVNPGQQLVINDAVAGINGANTLTLTRSGADTINGATSVVLNTARAGVVLTSNGSNAWSYPVIAGSGTVTNIATTAPITGGPITGSGTLTLNLPMTPGGRLTLQTGVPVTTTNSVAFGQFCYTPYVGNTIPLYDGTNFVPTVFSNTCQLNTDTTKSPAATVGTTAYDVFCWSDTGTVRCTRGPAWTNLTTRSAGTALTRVNGILLNNASITNGPAASRGTYVGSFFTNAGNTIDFYWGGFATQGAFALWNMYNRVQVATFEQSSIASTTFSAAAWVCVFADCNNNISVMTGLVEDSFTVINSSYISSSIAGQPCYLGISLDTGAAQIATAGAASGTVPTTTVAHYQGPGSLGGHVFYAVYEGNGVSTCTIYGNGLTGMSLSYKM